jgi:hypothetical protein
MRLRGMMPLVPTWYDIALRLLLTVVAGTLIGLNRAPPPKVIHTGGGLVHR